MTRFAYTAASSASNASLLAYRQLVEVGVTSSTIYASTGREYLYLLGNTYSPLGGLGGIDPVGESSEGPPSTLRLWLAAVGSADLFEPLREDMFNRPVTVRHVYLDPITYTAVSTPEKLWGGFVNRVQIRFGDRERGNFFEVEAETSLRKKAQATNFNGETLHTVLSQSGDTFFSLIHLVPTIKAVWGGSPTTVNGERAPGNWFIDAARDAFNRSRNRRNGET